MSFLWSLEELLPHDHPMILIDEIGEDAKGLLTTTRISEDCPFYEPKRGVPSCVGIEYVAQTVAALAGLKAKRAGDGVGLGYLLGTRHYKAREPYFPLGTLLTTRIESEFESDTLAKYRGEIFSSDGQQLVETSITLYSGPLAGIEE